MTLMVRHQLSSAQPHSATLPQALSGVERSFSHEQSVREHTIRPHDYSAKAKDFGERIQLVMQNIH